MHERPPAPEYVTRHDTRFVSRALVFSFGGMVIAAGPWAWARSIRSLTAGLGFAWDTALSLAVIMTPFAIWFAVAIGRERRLARRARAAGYRLCPRCAYALVGRRGSITCPECGRPCDMHEVERMWRAFRPRITGRSSCRAPGAGCPRTARRTR